MKISEVIELLARKVRDLGDVPLVTITEAGTVEEVTPGMFSGSLGHGRLELWIDS